MWSTSGGTTRYTCARRAWHVAHARWCAVTALDCAAASLGCMAVPWGRSVRELRGATLGGARSCVGPQGWWRGRRVVMGWGSDWQDSDSKGQWRQGGDCELTPVWGGDRWGGAGLARRWPGEVGTASKAVGEVATGGHRWKGNDGQSSKGGNDESADGDDNDERGWMRWSGAGRRRFGVGVWTACWKHLIGCCQ